MLKESSVTRKSRQMSIKVAHKNDFTWKIKDFAAFTIFLIIMNAIWEKIIVATGFEKLPKVH